MVVKSSCLWLNLHLQTGIINISHFTCLYLKVPFQIPFIYKRPFEIGDRVYEAAEMFIHWILYIRICSISPVLQF